MATTYDLRQIGNPLSRLWLEIEPRHGVTWRTRQYTLGGFEMTDERANEFMARFNASDVLMAVILDFGVTVYLTN